MKRFILLFAALWCLCLPSMAENRVIDEADLLTDAQEAALEEQIEQIRTQRQMDVVLLLKQSIGNSLPRYYAADYYDQGGYGLGESKDGVLFLLNMNSRDYFTLTTGNAIDVFTDARLDRMHEEIVPYLSNGEYFTALEKYLHRVDTIMSLGVPENTQAAVAIFTPVERANQLFPIVLIAALVISVITVLVMKGQLKTVRRKREATSYLQNGSFHLTRVNDIYLYTTTQRRKIETESQHGGGGGGSRGGGSSTFSGSSGTSHGGSGGKF